MLEVGHIKRVADQDLKLALIVIDRSKHRTMPKHLPVLVQDAIFHRRDRSFFLYRGQDLSDQLFTIIGVDQRKKRLADQVLGRMAGQRLSIGRNELIAPVRGHLVKNALTLLGQGTISGGTMAQFPVGTSPQQGLDQQQPHEAKQQQLLIIPVARLARTVRLNQTNRPLAGENRHQQNGTD